MKHHKCYFQIEDFDISGLKIGLVSEGFNWPHSDTRVNYVVREAIMMLQQAGAEVEEVSIPMLKYSK